MAIRTAVEFEMIQAMALVLFWLGNELAQD